MDREVQIKQINYVLQIKQFNNKLKKKLDFNEIDERLLLAQYLDIGQSKRYLKSIPRKNNLYIYLKSIYF